ncbi:DUF5708 family protein [Streptomyces sp. NPDC017943]|uniref:DUF5708 family protein n=1 Tax=Streptomyces sp. NPDC017943 TaxID=3365019 RepID=UPI00379D2B6A
MSRGRGGLLEGAVTFTAGLALWLFAGDVEVPWVTLTKVGVVMMCVGAAQAVAGAWRRAHRGA